MHWYIAGHCGQYNSPPPVKEFVGAQCGMTRLTLHVNTHDAAVLRSCAAIDVDLSLHGLMHYMTYSMT